MPSVVPACACPYSLGMDVQDQANFVCSRATQRGTPCPIDALQVQGAANLVCLRARQRGASVVSQVQEAANLACLRARQRGTIYNKPTLRARQRGTCSVNRCITGPGGSQSRPQFRVPAGETTFSVLFLCLLAALRDYYQFEGGAHSVLLLCSRCVPSLFSLCCLCAPSVLPLCCLCAASVLPVCSLCASFCAPIDHCAPLVHHFVFGLSPSVLPLCSFCAPFVPPFSVHPVLPLCPIVAPSVLLPCSHCAASDPFVILLCYVFPLCFLCVFHCSVCDPFVLLLCSLGAPSVLPVCSVSAPRAPSVLLPCSRCGPSVLPLFSLCAPSVLPLFCPDALSVPSSVPHLCRRRCDRFISFCYDCSCMRRPVQFGERRPGSSQLRLLAGETARDAMSNRGTTVQDAANLVCLRARQRGATVVSQVQEAANLACLRARQSGTIYCRRGARAGLRGLERFCFILL